MAVPRMIGTIAAAMRPLAESIGFGKPFSLPFMFLFCRSSPSTTWTTSECKRFRQPRRFRGARSTRSRRFTTSGFVLLVAASGCVQTRPDEVITGDQNYLDVLVALGVAGSRPGTPRRAATTRDALDPIDGVDRPAHVRRRRTVRASLAALRLETRVFVDDADKVFACLGAPQVFAEPRDITGTAQLARTRGVRRHRHVVETPQRMIRR